MSAYNYEIAYPIRSCQQTSAKFAFSNWKNEVSTLISKATVKLTKRQKTTRKNKNKDIQ